MSKEVNEERAPRTVGDVKEMLSKHSNGEIQRTIQNCITILQNDHVLAEAKTVPISPQLPFGPSVTEGSILPLMVTQGKPLPPAYICRNYT